MLEAIDVTKTYARGTALRRLNLRVDRGEVVALVGSPGAGKTTLVHLFLNWTRPSAGVCLIEGREASRAPAGRVVCLTHVRFSELVRSTELTSDTETRAFLLDDLSPDEPAGEAARCLRAMRDIAARGHCVLFATRSLRAAACCADRIGLLSQGRLDGILTRENLPPSLSPGASLVDLAEAADGCLACRDRSESA
jgi:ABC-type uncharacterized transport system ATPase subunit